MEPAAKVAEPPTVTGHEDSERAITIKWDPPTRNTDQSTPVNLLGYNVYRVLESKPDPDPDPLNKDPVTATQYADKTFKFGEKYLYFVRSVSLGPEGKHVDSRDSSRVPISQDDKYPPASPDLATPNAITGRIALFWSANTEPDLAGYVLFRSTDPNLPTNKWNKLTPEIYTKTTFTDTNVETGKTYYYYVIAVDTAGNPSKPSRVVSETVP
jgi:fibronectin type 3 domain-containing protein